MGVTRKEGTAIYGTENAGLDWLVSTSPLQLCTAGI